jgi:FAD/FMN-containing dehydrogenase
LRAGSGLVDALLASSRHWSVSLHFNKGLAGAPLDELEAARGTAINPAALGAFALAISASGAPPDPHPAAKSAPDLAEARRRARGVAAAMDALAPIAPDAGSYLAESDFFERDWQRSFWGTNYPRLSAVKRKYDPEGLFFVHHGVGSEDWSEDGFVRREGRRLEVEG